MSLTELSEILKKVVRWRLETELKGAEANFPTLDSVSITNSPVFDFIQQNKLDFPETIVLLVALVPHISPEFFSSIIVEYFPNGSDFPEFGGVKGKNHRGILPTGETVLYILAGKNVEKRMEFSAMFGEGHLFVRKNILFLENPGLGEPKMSGRLLMDEEYVDLFTTGKISKPKLSSDFPAELITTALEWKDLVLQDKTLTEIKEIETWLKFNEKLLKDWKMKGKIKPGFRVLFYGPAGTGKTMTASLLGKYTNRDVYRIDLSTVVSKYIGETEKNLSKLFNKAANKDWILFFDEADSIFGKRTNVRDAHDKYANQEVSYLLQRIESHEGLVILASNFKGNIDSSFTRRFNSIIEFENPGIEERIKLWENYIPQKVKIDKHISVPEIAGKYELTGANIVNVIHYAGLKTLEEKSNSISRRNLLEGIQKEYKKEGKLITKELR